MKKGTNYIISALILLDFISPASLYEKGGRKNQTGNNEIFHKQNQHKIYFLTKGYVNYGPDCQKEESELPKL